MCVVIHPVIAAQAWRALRYAGAGPVVSTAGIMHPNSAISPAPLLVDAVAMQIRLGGEKKAS